jgi:hypothetical protein
VEERGAGGVRKEMGGALWLTCEAGHVDAVGAADESDDAVGGSRAGEEGEEEEILGVHFGWVGGWFGMWFGNEIKEDLIDKGRQG